MAHDFGALFKFTAQVDGQAQVDRLAASVKGLGAASQVSAAQTAAAFRMLPAQFTDIATQLAGGQNPFMILLQQGGQIKDQFGGLGNTFRALASVLTPARLALGGVGAALAVVGKAFFDAQAEISEFNKKIAITGNYAGVTYGQFLKLAQAISSTTGSSIGGSKDVLMGAIGSGAFSSSTIGSVSTAMTRVKELTGQTADEVVKDFASMSQGVARWASEHNRVFNYLTYDQYKYIQGLERAGKTEEAMRVNVQALNAELEKRRPQLGWIEEIWKGIGKAASSAWDAMLNVGRPKTLEQEAAALDQMIKNAEALQQKMRERGQKVPPESPELRQAREELALLQARVKENNKLTQATAERAAAEKKRIADDASGLNDRKAAAALERQNIEFKAAADAQIRMLQDKQAWIDALHAREILSDQEYARQSVEIRRAMLDQEAELLKREIQTEQKRPTKDDADRMAVQNRILQLKARIAELTGKANSDEIKTGYEIDTLNERKAKALRYYSEDLQFQNELLALESQRVYMTDLAYKQLVDTKQREHDIAVKTRGMTADEAAAYRAAAEAAGTLKQEIEKANDAKSRTFGYGLAAGMKRIQADLADTGKVVEDALVRGFDNAADALADFVVTGKASFGDFARSVLKDLAKMIIKQQLFNLLARGMSFFGIGGPAAPGAGTAMAGTASVGMMAANGAAFDGGVQAFANGGVVNSPTLFKFANGGAMRNGLMGEAGPEAIMPLRRGSDGRLGVVATGAGSAVNVNVVVNAETGETKTSDSSNMAQLGNLIGARVREEIVRQQRPGGLLAA